MAKRKPIAKTNSPIAIKLCPLHASDLRWEKCSKGFTGTCDVEYARKKHGRVSLRIDMPEDIAALPISRQGKRHLALKRLGLCVKCGEKLFGKELCLYHRIKQREKYRKMHGHKKRLLGCASYDLEMEIRREQDESNAE